MNDIYDLAMIALSLWFALALCYGLVYELFHNRRFIRHCIKRLIEIEKRIEDR